MRPIVQNLIYFLLFLFLTTDLHATHILGGEISYECLQPNVYQVKLVYYRDCTGIGMPQQYNITAFYSCTQYTVTVGLQSTVDVSPVFWGNMSSCNGGPGLGVQKVTYTGVFTAAPNCGPIFYGASTCCRSPSITNISDPSLSDIRLETINVETSICNSTPIFNSTPIMMGCVNQTLIYDQMAYDLEGDSLTYSLIDCQSTQGPVWYNPAYSGNAFLGTFVPVTIDPNTGVITVTPVQPEVASVCIMVEEYRNGQLISSTYREIQCVIIQDCSLISYSEISGQIIHDLAADCIDDSTDIDLAGWNVVLNPGGYVTQTDANGYYLFYGVPIGTYQITVLYDSILWSMVCPNSGVYAPVITTIQDSSTGNDFYMFANYECADLYVDVSVPRARPCFSNNNVYVQYCNDAQSTVGRDSVYVTVELDTTFFVLNSSVPATSILGNLYEFYVGYLAPGECGSLVLQCSVSCAAPIGQTVCVDARIYPIDSCTYRDDTTATGPCGIWDQSSLMVEGECINGNLICFYVINTGDPVDGDMECYQEVRIYIDSALFMVDSVLLAGGDTATFCFPANGATWRLEVDQHPGHPGNSQPNAVVELCGNSTQIANNWTPGVPNQFIQDDDDMNQDIDCVETAAAYDPNDKRGFPLGLTDLHLIEPNTSIEYMIRFQNTGTDTAFTVVIQDTIPAELDMSSIYVGASSHSYSFAMISSNVIEWTFNNILLPDSSTNPDASQGFVSFKIDQQKDLPLGTYIHNEAYIYFDFNAPIITNESEHLIGDLSSLGVITSSVRLADSNTEVLIFPNPTKQILNLKSEDIIIGYQLVSLNGTVIQDGVIDDQYYQLNIQDLQTGVYILFTETETGRQIHKLIKQ